MPGHDMKVREVEGGHAVVVDDPKDPKGYRIISRVFPNKTEAAIWKMGRQR